MTLKEQIELESARKSCHKLMVDVAKNNISIEEWYSRTHDVILGTIYRLNIGTMTEQDRTYYNNRWLKYKQKVGAHYACRHD